MQPPFLCDDRFLEDVQQARGEPGRLHIWWLGQSGFLLQWQGRHLLLDPYLSDSLTDKYAASDKPHVRMTGRVLAPERLDFVDVVTSSHNHTDHLDAATLLPLIAVNPNIRVVMSSANIAFAAERLRCNPTWLLGVDDGVTLSVGVFEITGVPAAHESIEQDQLGRHKFLGLIVRCGPWTVYHSGDTLLYAGMVEKLRPWPVDVAILPINGRAPERLRRWQSGWQRGCAACPNNRCRDRHSLPLRHVRVQHLHTGLFLTTCAQIGQAAVVLRNGERWSSEVK